MLIIGNQKSGWRRVSSWSSPATLAQVVDDIQKGLPQSAQK
jgi:hypothetical protein